MMAVTRSRPRPPSSPPRQPRGVTTFTAMAVSQSRSDLHRAANGTFSAMTNQSEKAARFLDLHRPGNPLLLPNPWDQGSARLLASLGFQALATTSSGYAATLGRLDGSVNREEALTHAAAIVAATELPVSADLENCFADDPAGVARTVALGVEAGLAARLHGGLP